MKTLAISFDFSFSFCIIVCSFFIALFLAFLLKGQHLCIKKTFEDSTVTDGQKKAADLPEVCESFVGDSLTAVVDEVTDLIDDDSANSNLDSLKLGDSSGGADLYLLPSVVDAIASKKDHLHEKKKNSLNSTVAPAVGIQGNFKEYWKRLGLIDVDENTAPVAFEIRPRRAVLPVKIAAPALGISNGKTYSHHTPTTRHTGSQSSHRAPKPQRYYSAFESTLDFFGNGVNSWAASHPKLPSGWRTPSPDLVDPNFLQFKKEFISPVVGESNYNE